MRAINAPSTRAVVLSVAICAAVLGTLVAFSKYGLPRFRDADFGHLHNRPWWFGDDDADPVIDDGGRNSTYVLADGSSWKYDYQRDGRKYGLNSGQCMAGFPMLYEEIDRAVQYRDKVGNITLEDVHIGPTDAQAVRAMIWQNKLYIVETQGMSDEEHRSRSLATLSALNRAITSSPSQLPTIEFTITDHDSLLDQDGSRYTTWTYARLAKQQSFWLIPDFGFWSWPEVGVRSYSELLSILDDSENDFLDKSPQLVWRGGPQSEHSKSRDALFEEAEGQAWANVKDVDWQNETSVKQDYLPMEDQCENMFLAHTEGKTYANRLKYLLNCHSIVVTHELDWIEHFHHLLSPSGSNQNYIKVKRDFSDLPSTMKKAVGTTWQQNSGRMIADNAQRTFRERYLTPAAEACYWRALIRGWASVQGFQPQVWVEDGESSDKRRPRGTPFESYIFNEMVD